MKRYLLLLPVLMICSCTTEDAPYTHDCTEEQMSKVEHETKWCIDNKIFTPDYCYKTAIMRNCTKMVEVEK